MIGKLLDEEIKERVEKILQNNKFPEYDEVYTDTFSELIDKLIITHIRYWYLEDAMSSAKNDKELVEYRKKSESLFKEKRPMLVKALDKMIYQILTEKIKYTPSNVKKYENWENEY